MSDSHALIPRERLEQMLQRAELASEVTLKVEDFRALVKQAIRALKSPT